MSRRILNKEQLEVLRGNRNVANCSERSITFSREFKLTAIKQHNKEGSSPKEIFRRANFDLDTIGRDTPKECIKRWSRACRIKGTSELDTEKRGRNKIRKDGDMVEKERIKYLEAEVAYLKAENDFLAKLRAKRRSE